MLDAKHNKADLQSRVSNNCKHLSANYQQEVAAALMNYEMLFDGTLGDWKTKPVSFQYELLGVRAYP
jgi:hypothetical protein